MVHIFHITSEHGKLALEQSIDKHNFNNFPHQSAPPILTKPNTGRQAKQGGCLLRE